MATKERRHPESLPEHVIEVKSALSKMPDHQVSPIAVKLVQNSPELIRMWKRLHKCGDSPEGDCYYDTVWVWAFLERAESAATVKPYERLNDVQRTTLIDRIERLSSQLAKALVENGLDAHLVFSDKPPVEGVFLYENCSERHRELMDESPLQKISIVGEALPSIASYCRETISSAPFPTLRSAVKSADAIRFVRLMALGNHDRFGDALWTVIATATNAIFDLDYTAGDVINLLNRVQ